MNDAPLLLQRVLIQFLLELVNALVRRRYRGLRFIDLALLFYLHVR